MSWFSKKYPFLLLLSLLFNFLEEEHLSLSLLFFLSALGISGSRTAVVWVLMTGSHDPFSPSHISTTMLVWRWLRGKGPDGLFLLLPRTGAYWAAGCTDWRRSMSYFKKRPQWCPSLSFCLRFWKDNYFIFAGLPNGLNLCISPVFSSPLELRSNLDRCSFL